MYQTTNPATGEVLKQFPTTTDAQIEEALQASHQAYLELRDTDVAARQAVLRSVAKQYRDRKREIARLIGLEMGKPVAQAEGEVEIVASIYDYYADNGPRLIEQEDLTVTGGGSAFVLTRPVGSVLGIMPWNYPHYQIARFAAPNILLGNSVLLKHSPICPQNALLVEELFGNTEVTKGAYINIFASDEQVKTIIEDERNQGVSLTGSERAGAAVAGIAGAALKKAVLELGGNDAFILLDTEDMEKTVDAAITGRMANAGQACNSPKRFIILDELYDDFVAGMKARIGDFVPGDPSDEGTAIGPVSSRAAAENLKAVIDDAVERGATLHHGGELSNGADSFLTPTLITDVPRDARMYREEVFGPVAVVYRVASVDEAIDLANDTPYGLSCMVHSASVEKATEVADRLDTGMASINGVSGTQADVPFGGIKKSGFGRELGELGILEFANKKVYRVS